MEKSNYISLPSLKTRLYSMARFAEITLIREQVGINTWDIRIYNEWGIDKYVSVQIDSDSSCELASGILTSTPDGTVSRDLSLVSVDDEYSGYRRKYSH